MLRHDECMESRSFRHDEETTDEVQLPLLTLHHRCVSLISAITWLAFCNACGQDIKKKKKQNNETTDKRTSNHQGTPDSTRWESVTCSMSAASLRRWAMSSDSVSRSLRRPDLYSWPTSSLWRLSFTWLTRKCITAFGTLRWRKGERKQAEQMVENKEARWPGDCDCAPDGGARVWPTRWLCLSKYRAVEVRAMS